VNIYSQDEFEKQLRESDEGSFSYDPHSLKMFFKSVTESLFTVVGGLPGTGKTTLCEKFLSYVISKDDDYPSRVPIVVRCTSNWKESRDLVGYYSSDEKVYIATPFIKALLAALRDRNREYFFLIDSIDSGNVSGFLSDVVAALSSVRPMPVHDNSRCVPVNTAMPEERNLICHNDCFSCFFALKEFSARNIPGTMASFVPPHVTFPSNFHILATVQGTKPLSGFDSWMVDKINWIFLSSIEWSPWLIELEENGLNPSLSSFIKELVNLCSHNHIHMGWRILSRIASIGVPVSQSEPKDEKSFAEILDLEFSMSVVPIILDSHLFNSDFSGDVRECSEHRSKRADIISTFIELTVRFYLNESAKRLSYMIQNPCS
jgi:hypothetical protein